MAFAPLKLLGRHDQTFTPICIPTSCPTRLLDSALLLLLFCFHSFNTETQEFSGTDLGRAAAFAAMSPDMAIGVQAGERLLQHLCAARHLNQGCAVMHATLCRHTCRFAFVCVLCLFCVLCFSVSHACSVCASHTVAVCLSVDLERARTWGLVTGTDLHAMFLVTPTWELGRLHPNWQK